MKILNIPRRAADRRLFRSLERRGLIKTLTPSAKLLGSRSPDGCVDTVYVSAPRFGSHKLICVKPNSSQVKLNSHPDNEEFILIDSRPRRIGKKRGAPPRNRPLYLLMGLFSHEVTRKKAARGTLTAKDFLLVRMRFNDPATCVFTMLKGTPHCEIVFPGRGDGPVFFVSEPSGLPMNMLELPGYSLEF